MVNEGGENNIAVTDINNFTDGFVGITLFSNVINANIIVEKP